MKKPNLLILFLGLIVSVNALAQTINLQPIDPKRESARATLKTFLDAFQQPRLGVTPDPLEEAVKCLDLHAIPLEYRIVKGLEVSVQLREIIDAVENFQVEDVSVETNAEPFVVFRSQLGEITIARQSGGEWLFTQETVKSIPLLLASIEEDRRTHGTATLTQSESIGDQLRNQMPSVLRQKTLLLERWQWLGLLILLILGIIVWQIAKIVVSFVLGRILRRRYTFLTDEHLKHLNAPVGLLAFVVTFRLGLRALALTQNTLVFFRTTMFLLTAIAIIWIAYRAVDIISFKLRKNALETESQTDDLLVPFISVIIRIAIVIIGVIMVAENLDFNVTGLVAGLGIGGIAIALASQETLSNFFGSLVLLIERPFTSEDRVVIDGIQGTVKEIGLRSTRIFTIDNTLVTLPNSSIAKANIVNDGSKGHRSWIIKLSVPCQNGAAKIEKMCDGITEIIKKSEFVDNELFKLHLFDLNPPSMILRVELKIKIDTYDFELEARNQFIREVLRLADKLAIKM